MGHQMTVRTVSVAYDGDSLGDRLDQPQVAGGFIAAYLETLDSDQEHLGILALDGRHRLIGVKVLASGTRTQAPVDAAKLFQTALILGATGFILFHTHPSGDLDPSRDDLELTRRLVRGGQLIGVNALDHFILNPEGRWLSLRTSRADLFTP